MFNIPERRVLGATGLFIGASPPNAAKADGFCAPRPRVVHRGMEKRVPTAAQDVARTLKAIGIRQVFALCADQTNSLLDALSVEGIEIAGTRQESAAVHMADGWARATGEPGVAIVGAGPGYVNAVTGMAVSQSAATPVIVIAGQPSLHTRERNGHQILHQADIARTLTKWSQEIYSPAIAAEFVCRGFTMATSGKPGPVSLSIPLNVLDADAEGSVYKPVRHNWWPHSLSTMQGPEISKALAILSTARSPVMVVGGGAWWEVNRSDLLSIVSRLRIPVFTTELSRGLIEDDGQVCFGYAHPSFNRTFRELPRSDLLVLVGTEMNLHTGAPARKLIGSSTRILQLHRDAGQIGVGRPTDVALIGPLKGALEALAAGLAPSATERYQPWLKHIRERYAAHREEWSELTRKHSGHGSGEIHPMQVCASLARYYSKEVRVIIDGGDFVHWPRLYLQALMPGYWMDGAEIGALGASLPVGIGAQLGNPAQQTWVFIGDGGIGFYGFEISTAVEHNLPLKIIIGNDRCWGVERRLQQKHYGRTVATSLPDIQYHALAQSLGAQALLVEDAGKLDSAIDAMVKSDGPFVLNIRITRDAGRPLMD